MRTNQDSPPPMQAILAEAEQHLEKTLQSLAQAQAELNKAEAAGASTDVRRSLQEELRTIKEATDRLKETHVRLRGMMRRAAFDFGDVDA